MKKVLTIAASDSIGGAGIEADIKTITVFKMYAMCAVTALTAQNTTGVFGIDTPPAQFLTNQLECVFEDVFPDAVKIGMMSTAENAIVTAEALKKYKAKNIVLDPVMISTSGHSLFSGMSVEDFAKIIFPTADLLTPNLFEASAICGFEIKDEKDMLRGAKEIFDKYGCAALIKGGHLGGVAADVLYDGKETSWFASKRIDNPNTHGTGCTLSSAIACSVADGMSLKGAVARAKKYLSGAIAANLDLGKGRGPLNHMYNI